MSEQRWMRPRSSRRAHALIVADAFEAYAIPAPAAVCGLVPKAGWAAAYRDGPRCPACETATE